MSQNIKSIAGIFFILVVITIVLAGYAMLNKPARAQVSNTVTPTNSAAAAPSITPATTASGSQASTSLTFPIRAAFYNDLYPDAWEQKGSSVPNTNYTSTLGTYDSSDPQVIRAHIAAMQYGNISAGIVTWGGQGTQSDENFATLLEASAGTNFRWAIYYQPQANATPTAEQIATDLKYLSEQFANDASYLQINGRFVVLVSSKASNSCDMADLWKKTNTVNAYIVLNVFSGYRSCASQPDGWYQYAPSSAEDAQKGFSYTISPGYWKVGENARLPRDLSRWYTSIRNMVASKAPFQLITSFNQWDEGKAIESAKEWESASGYGAFLDALHTNGEGTPPVLAFATAPQSVKTATPQPINPPKNAGQAPVSPAGQAPLNPAGQATPTTQAKPAGRATPTLPIQLPQIPIPALPAIKGDPVLGAAGDIACDPASPYWSATGNGKNPNDCREKQTSDILVSLRQAGQLSAVADLGDDVYENGAYQNYITSYDPTWGRLKDITRPAPGNHEYLTKAASGYYQYFGAAAGDPKKGYYSYDLGSWHIIVMNSNCSQVGGCSKGSPQETWLSNDLSQHAGQCTLAYWHHPLYSSGEHGDFTGMQTIWQDLYNYGTSVVLSGHSHDYERFAPQDANGKADPNGIREFVVGTGGKNHTGLYDLQPNSEVFNDKTYGILKLTLHSNSYDWQFMPEAGKTFTDSGTGTCQPRHP